MSRKEDKFYKCIGINEDGALIMLDYIFESESMCGATGTEFYALTQEEVDQRRDVEFIEDTYDIKYHWKEAVAAGDTTDSYEDFRDSWIDNADGEFFGHDDSYIHHIPEDIRAEYFPDAVTFECVGGGRMFPRALENLEVILEPGLIKQIIEVEKRDEQTS